MVHGGIHVQGQGCGVVRMCAVILVRLEKEVYKFDIENNAKEGNLNLCLE